GPPIPRRDRTIDKERHARLMLILFKPWREPRDLITTGSSWEEAFQQTVDDLDERFHQIMNNFQLLHECKDSRDD
ncbi:hypothetical protein FKP32DRAFT_1532147, partial [Trametes sanguinea]